ncbi:DUF6020 family protein [Collinsella sp. D33t1_170424_A12]|uniref:DUF6020 family protein n=1 Tax=Collinsella sp. D33t1_170424_A12 TaxID=2787135 RepID=UPI001897404B
MNDTKQVERFGSGRGASAGRIDARFAVVSVLFSLLYAASLAIGRNLARTGTCDLGSMATWVTVLVLAAPLSIAGYAMLSWASSRHRVAASEGLRMRVRHPFLLAWSVICLAWLPVLIARWPGDFCFDAMWQTAFVAPDTTNISEYWSHLNAWHPPLHSLWLGGSLVLGQTLFGSYGAGLAVYTVSQTLIFSLCLARVVSYAYESGHLRIYVAALAFAALFPGFSVYATMTTKDVVFSGLLALVALWVYRTVRDDIPSTGIRSWLMYGFLLFLLSMLMRNNALHAFLVVVLLALVLHAGRAFDARRLLVALVPAIALSLVITGPVYRALDIKPGPSKEIMSVPSVQLASVLVDHGAELDPADRAYIEQLVPDWRKYDRNTLADATKEHFNTGLVSSDPLRFARVYLGHALRYPGNFINAWALLSAGYWSQSVSYANEADAVQLSLMCPYDAVRGVLPQYLAVPFERPVPPLSDAVDSALASRFEANVPVLNLFFKASTWFWLAMAYVFACIALRVPASRMIPAAVLLAYCLTLFLGPGSLYRYASPLFTSLPLLLVMMADLAGASVASDSAYVPAHMRA